MQWLVLLALAGGSPATGSLDGTAFASVAEAASGLQPVCQTGTLLVTKGDCLAVRIYTQSPYTHVAAVVVRNDQICVYDSTNGVGVRCLSLAQYLASQNPDQIHVFQPASAFSPQQSASFETWLDGQLGRPYAVAHHLTGERAAGLHCAEYVTDALVHADLMRARQPARVSPASLVTGITRHGVYASGQTVLVKPPPPPALKSDSWCGQLWQETKDCTSGCCTRMRRWFLCR